ncbi:MAG: hypothetical protein R3B81_00335 [bacterium]
MKNPASRILAAVGLVFLCAALADASTIFVSQDRSTSVSGEIHNANTGQTTSDQMSESAPDVSPFLSNVSVGVGGDASLAFVRAIQNSFLEPDSISTDGSSFALLLVPTDSTAVTSYGVAMSNFDVTFELTGTAAFTLTGQLQCVFAGEAAATLTGPAGVVYDVTATTETVLVDVAGTLIPGQYRLEVHALVEGTVPLDAPNGAFQALYEIVLALQPTVSVQPASWAGVKSAYRSGPDR